jgi:16S rRNA G1207 methylase RsmC
MAVAAPPPRPQEQLLIDLLPEFAAARVLCTSLGLGQLATAAARQFPDATVHCQYLDLYRAEQARAAIERPPSNLSIVCTADFPAMEVELVALPFASSGEAELTRDLMQAGHELLRPGGSMIASTENRQDRWLHAQMQDLFGTVTRRPAEQGVAYLARKKQPLKKRKDFAAEFAFRDRGRLIRAYSRPGVFSHRRLDPGSRQLLNYMEVFPGERVLDIGCGFGGLALAAALRAAGVQVHAVDSNARAVQCTARGAELNGLANVSAALGAATDGGQRWDRAPSRHQADERETDEAERLFPLLSGRGPCTLVLANPPYYAAFDIARRFLLAGRAALEPGGRILVVTKSPAWYEEHMPRWFDEVQVEGAKEYSIASGRRPRNG